MIEVKEFVKRAAEKSGFVRDRFNEDNIPTIADNICVLPFFGDTRSMSILSSLLFKGYREKVKGSKYFILCTWPGYESLFPYMDEVWSIRDKATLKKLHASSCGFDNKSELSVIYTRKLNRFFDDVVDPNDFNEYYNQGLTANYIKLFGDVQRSLPLIQSPTYLGNEYSRSVLNRPGYKVFLHPSLHVKSYRTELENIKISKEFWIELTRFLVEAGYCPILASNFATHDISDRFGDQCVYLEGDDISKTLCAMRASDCVIDLFSDISRLAMLARAPYVAFIERIKYVKLSEHELDDLCSLQGFPKQYIFSFTTILEGVDNRVWKSNIFDLLLSKLKAFLPLNKDILPSTSELDDIIPYSSVRKRKVKKLGTKFIKVERD
jgi:hypothetical protein